MSAVIILCSCGSSDPPPGSMGAHPECDTDLALTSGGDWGAPFDADGGADSSGGGGVVYDPPEEWAADPTEWELHTASGTYYRSPTQDELIDNAWADATLLVIPPSAFVAAVTSGNASATLAIPIPMAEYPGNEQASLDFETISLSRAQTHESLSFVVATLNSQNDVVNTTIKPNLHFYLPSGIDWDDHDETVVRLFASSRGGLEINGGRRNDRMFRLHGPYDASNGRYTLDIAPPNALGSPRFYLMRTGFAPPPVGLLERGPAGIGDIAPFTIGASTDSGALTSLPISMATATISGQCQDERDNDADGFGDACDFACVPHPDFGGRDFDYTVEYEQTKNFALIGDGPFCMQNELNFEAVLADIGMSAAQMLNWVEAPSGRRVPPVRFAWGGCFNNFNTYGDALACHADSNECDDPSEYPFAGVAQNYGSSVGNDLSGYIGHVWRAVDDRAAAAADASDIHPVSMAVAIANVPSTIENVVGLAYFPLTSVEPNNTRTMYGAAVVLAPDGLELEDNEAEVDSAGRRVAHELGHTLGLQHDTAPGGFMGQYGGTLPILDWEADSLLEILAGSTVTGYRTQEYAWTQYAPSKWAPRPSGFGYTPCISDSECDNGHPGLECLSGWCR